MLEVKDTLVHNVFYLEAKEKEVPCVSPRGLSRASPENLLHSVILTDPA